MPLHTSPARDPPLPHASRRVASQPGRPDRRVRAPPPRSAGTVAGLGRDPACVGLGARLTHPAYRTAACTGAWNEPPTDAIPAPSRARGNPERVSGRRSRRGSSLLVPLERHLAHEVGVRVLDALVPAQSAREATDAPLAAHAAHHDRLGRHHVDGTRAVSCSRTSRSARPMRVDRGWRRRRSCRPVRELGEQRSDLDSRHGVEPRAGLVGDTTGVRAANARASATRSR